MAGTPPCRAPVVSYPFTGMSENETRDISGAGAAGADTPTQRLRVREALSAPPKQVGPYQILGLIGEGGMGAVYRAQQDKPRRVVALKVIRPGLLSNEMLRRFEFEADVLARLEHPGIARVYDAGIAQTPNGPQPFFAMELVEGARLNEYLKAKSPAR